MRRSPAAMTLAATLTGLALVGASAAPAQANDKTLKIRNSNGKVIAKAWYDDGTDNLCVRSYRKGKLATVRIGPSGGITFASANDAGFRKPNNCTGNMSIPEDRLYWMTLSTEGKSSKDATFYT